MKTYLIIGCIVYLIKFTGGLLLTALKLKSRSNYVSDEGWANLVIIPLWPIELLLTVKSYIRYYKKSN